jgi:hypothetical protein
MIKQEQTPHICSCGHRWAQHIRTANGALACRYFGCGCRDVVGPDDNASKLKDEP